MSSQAPPSRTHHDLLSELRKTQREVSPEAVAARLGNKDFTFLDVRETDEFSQGHLPGAVHVPRGFLELRIENTIHDRQRNIVVYCGGGVRSLYAAETLQRMGYSHVESMAGGYSAWSKLKLPSEAPVGLTDKQRRRYARHLSIPDVGEKGQAKLLASKVLLIGAGGLGSPAAYYLTAAGVGTLGLVDFDVVDESNLQRQILHTADRVGQSKLTSAQKTLKDFSPDTVIIPFAERIDRSNVERIVQDFDIVVDGSDNFPTRYLLNDVCVKLRKPCVHGSVYRFEGQVSVFAPTLGGPCYRCLYSQPPPPELAPSCAEAGVFGVLPGVIGLLQAVETIKLITGIGQPLVGRLLAYDALAASFQELLIHKDPQCTYCSKSELFPGYVDYEQFCSTAL